MQYLVFSNPTTNYPQNKIIHQKEEKLGLRQAEKNLLRWKKAAFGREESFLSGKNPNSNKMGYLLYEIGDS